MGWRRLGTVDLSYDWQFLFVPVLRYSLFRVTQLYSDTDYIHGKIIITQTFNTPLQFYNYRSIYPSKDLKIIQLLTPEEIIKDPEEIYTKRLGFKFDRRYYRYSISWAIQVEVQDVIATNLDLIQGLEIENRENVAYLQKQLNQVEQALKNTTDRGQSTPDSNLGLF